MSIKPEKKREEENAMSKARELIGQIKTLAEAKDPIAVTQSQVMAMLKSEPKIKSSLRTQGITFVKGKFPDGDNLQVNIGYGKNKDEREFRLIKGSIGGGAESWEFTSLKPLGRKVGELVG